MDIENRGQWEDLSTAGEFNHPEMWHPRNEIPGNQVNHDELQESSSSH